MNKHHLPSSKPCRCYFVYEISDLNKRTIFLNYYVDGEVSIHGPHLVMEAHCITLVHALYMTADSAMVASFFLFPHQLSTWSFLFPFQGE